MNSDLYIWLAAGAALLVGLSKGGLPAVGMLAVPLLSLVMSPVKAAVLLLPIFVISDVIGIWLYRRDYSAVNLRILMPARRLFRSTCCRKNCPKQSLLGRPPSFLP